MPRYAMVAHMAVPTSNALSGSRFRRPLKPVPMSWHLAEIVGDDIPSTDPVCGGPTLRNGERAPLTSWASALGRCPRCERLAGEAARAQVAIEAEGT